MLTHLQTSILTSSAQTIVCPANCEGVMGAGLAGVLAKRYPTMFATYRGICRRGLLRPGKLWLWKRPERWVLVFPTKDKWRDLSHMEWVESGLKNFSRTCEARGIESVAFPRLGCGLGGLLWPDVKLLMELYLGPLDIPVAIHNHVPPAKTGALSPEPVMWDDSEKIAEFLARKGVTVLPPAQARGIDTPVRDRRGQAEKQLSNLMRADGQGALLARDAKRLKSP